MKHFCVLLLSPLLVLASLRPNLHRLAELQDTDGDGFISEAEARTKFESFELDGSGKLEMEEFTALVREQIGLINSRLASRDSIVARMAADRFELLDLNRNGGIEFSELSFSLDEVDRDGDGRISVHEAAEYMKRNSFISKVLREIDSNSNGFVEDEEVLSLFQSHDRDGNGEISKEEWRESLRAKLEENSMTYNENMLNAMVKAFFDKVDRNGDDVVAENELRPNMETVDIDGDGKVSLPEFKRDMLRIHGRGGRA